MSDITNKILGVPPNSRIKEFSLPGMDYHYVQHLVRKADCSASFIIGTDVPEGRKYDPLEPPFLKIWLDQGVVSANVRTQDTDSQRLPTLIYPGKFMRRVIGSWIADYQLPVRTFQCYWAKGYVPEESINFDQFTAALDLTRNFETAVKATWVYGSVLEPLGFRYGSLRFAPDSDSPQSPEALKPEKILRMQYPSTFIREFVEAIVVDCPKT